MLKIRLQRVGRRNTAAFRVVVTESTRGPKSGNNVELLGSYSPHSDKAELNIERIKHWLSKGAQVSDTLYNLLVRENIIEGRKKNVLSKKSPVSKKKEGKGEEASEEVKQAQEEAGESDAKEASFEQSDGDTKTEPQSSTAKDKEKQSEEAAPADGEAVAQEGKKTATE